MNASGTPPSSSTGELQQAILDFSEDSLSARYVSNLTDWQATNFHIALLLNAEHSLKFGQAVVIVPIYFS